MNFKRNSLKNIAVIFIILTILCMPASFAADGDYSLPSVVKDINITDDGTAIISENITYSITGTVNGVYRDVSLSGDQRLENISVETPGYYNTLEVINSSGKTQLKVWLYKDEAKTQKVSDEDVSVIYHYNFIKGVKIYNDIAEFQYMSWGSDWDRGVDTLITNIQIPGSNTGVEMWNNPPDIVTESIWTSDNTLHTTYNDLNSNQNAEQRILIPKSYFKSTENADVINKNAKEEIEQDQKDYQNNINNKNTAMILLSGLLVLLMFVPGVIYYRYGREPKIDYKADYESQLPTNDSPIFINMMVNGNVGESDLNGFQATLLNLVDEGYYKIISNNDNDTIIKTSSKDTGNLKQYELDVINYLDRYADKKGNISFKKIGEGDSLDFSKFMDAWEIDVNREVNSQKISRLFNDEGNSIISLSSALSIIFAIFVIIAIFVFDTGVYAWIPLLVSLSLIVELIIVLNMSNTFMGQWTPEGKEFHDKWKNFERYIKDYSLIKEYPPASVQVWGKYLVYATALGCADKVSKNMKKYFKEMDIPESELYASDAVFFSWYGGTLLLHDSFNSLNTPPTDTGSFGDIGDIGSGGFGGGGGGVF